MKTPQLGYVIHYVPEVLKTVEFYERAFGLARLFVHESGEFAQMNTGTTGLAFCAEALAAQGCAFEPMRPERKAPAVEIGLVTTEVQSAFDRAVAAGAVVERAPAQKPWGQTVAYVRDLNGFLVELCSPMG